MKWNKTLYESQGSCYNSYTLTKQCDQLFVTILSVSEWQCDSRHCHAALNSPLHSVPVLREKRKKERKKRIHEFVAWRHDKEGRREWTRRQKPIRGRRRCRWRQEEKFVAWCVCRISRGWRERTGKRGQADTGIDYGAERPHPLPPSAGHKGLANRRRDTRRIEREILRSRRPWISASAPAQAPTDQFRLSTLSTGCRLFVDPLNQLFTINRDFLIQLLKFSLFFLKFSRNFCVAHKMKDASINGGFLLMQLLADGLKFVLFLSSLCEKLKFSINARENLRGP